MRKMKLITSLSILGAISTVTTSCTWHPGKKNPQYEYDPKLAIKIEDGSSEIELEAGVKELSVTVTYDGEPVKIKKIISAESSDKSIFDVTSSSVTVDGEGVIQIDGFTDGYADLTVVVEDENGHINEVKVKLTITGQDPGPDRENGCLYFNTIEEWGEYTQTDHFPIEGSDTWTVHYGGSGISEWVNTTEWAKFMSEAVSPAMIIEGVITYYYLYVVKAYSIVNRASFCWSTEDNKTIVDYDFSVKNPGSTSYYEEILKLTFTKVGDDRYAEWTFEYDWGGGYILNGSTSYEKIYSISQIEGCNSWRASYKNNDPDKSGAHFFLKASELENRLSIIKQ